MPGPAVAAGVAKNAPLLAHEPEAERVGEQLTGELVGVEPERDRVDAADRVLGGNSRAGPTGACVGGGMRDELAHEPFVVLECDDALVLVARDGLLELDLLPDKSLDPEADRAGKNRERCDRNLAAALPSASRIGPGEEGQDAARISLTRRRSRSDRWSGRRSSRCA